MTMTETKTPAVDEDERRRRAACDRRRAAELRLRVWREVECQAQVDPVQVFYADPVWLWTHAEIPSDRWEEMGPAERRVLALRWLRQHVAGLREIAARLEVPFKVEKIATDYYYGVAMWVPHHVDSSVRVKLEATVPAETTCEIKVVGSEHVEAHDRPITEKVCPPSIYASVADELVPAEDTAPVVDEEVF